MVQYKSDFDFFQDMYSKINDNKVVSINQRDNNGLTMLMKHAYEGNYEDVELMIDAGALVNMQAYNGISALMAAATGHDAIVELLLINGASLDQRDRNGDSPIDFAMKNKHFDIACTFVYFKPFSNELKSYNDIKHMEVAKCILASGNIVKFHLSSVAPYLGKNIISYAESIYGYFTEENLKYGDRLDEVEIYRKDPVKYILEHHIHSSLALDSIDNLESSGYTDSSIDKVKACLQPIGYNEDLYSICGEMALTQEI